MIAGSYFDGVSPHAQPASLRIVASEGALYIVTALGELGFQLARCDLGEATANGTRLIMLPTSSANPAQFQAQSDTDLNAYLRQHAPKTHSFAANIAQSWRWVLVSLLLITAACAALYVWGIPAFAKVAAPMIPQSVRDTIGQSTFKTLDQQVFTPSKLSVGEQVALRIRWEAVLDKAYPNGVGKPRHTLYFRGMGSVPNAMALPDGTIVISDGLVSLLADRPDAIMGVLAHELGHLSKEHSMRNLIQFTSIAALSSVVMGDYTGWASNLPLIVGQTTYTRQHEAEADDEAIRIMRAAGISPAELAMFFKRVGEKRSKGVTDQATNPSDSLPKDDEAAEKDSGKDSGKNSTKDKDKAANIGILIPDVLSTHPSDASRIKKLEDAAQGL